MVTMLKVIVGSRAHGLAGPESDFDYRGVFLHPTSHILSLGAKPKQTAWVEGVPIPDYVQDTASGKIDDTAWELGHFLHLATHCNPTILEVFAAPVESATEDGERMRALFPYIWQPQGVKDAFVGYGLNQRKKFLDGKDVRPHKYAVAYLRVLYQASVLLTEGRLPVLMIGSPVYDTLKRWRAKDYTVGEVVETCLEWERRVRLAAPVCKQKQDLGPVNDFLLDVRRRSW